MLTNRFSGNGSLIRESKHLEETVFAERQAKVLDRRHHRRTSWPVDSWSFDVLWNISGNRSTSDLGEISILELLDSGRLNVVRLYFTFHSGSLQGHRR